MAEGQPYSGKAVPREEIGTPPFSWRRSDIARKVAQANLLKQKKKWRQWRPWAALTAAG